MKILVIGATGMLGHAMLKELSNDKGLDVFGTIRGETILLPGFTDDGKIIYGIDVLQHDSLVEVFDKVKPSIVINCAGLIKQNVHSKDSLKIIPINSILPHKLAQLCNIFSSRLIHISTDCVFSGDKGYYCESDQPDARDLYGQSKLLGEVNYPNTVTLRTSIIGHELKSRHGLLSWFLAQGGTCRGYTKAIFSGLPTVILADIVGKIVIQHPNLTGIYHVGAEPISKYKLLTIMASVYGKNRDNPRRLRVD